MSVKKTLPPAGRKSRSPSYEAVEDSLVLLDTCCANEESEHRPPRQPRRPPFLLRVGLG